MSYYQRQRDRWEADDREFIMSAVVTKVYTIEVPVTASSDEEARAIFADMQAEIASNASDDNLEETIVEEEGCYDPLTGLDD